MSERKTHYLAGIRLSSEQLRGGLPIFYSQLLFVLKLDRSKPILSAFDETGMKTASINNDEVAMLSASARPEEAKLPKSAGAHGLEFLRLGYTLSQVAHAYSSMCQSITELATTDSWCSYDISGEPE